MLRGFKTDLHIHTCLSPCAETDMIPRMIVETAKSKGMDIIGICDHNSAENVIYAKKAAKKTNLTVIGGMEITSKEEVHVLALFDDKESLLELQHWVYDNLPGENDEQVFGSQVNVNERDEVVGSTNRLLIGATKIGVDEVVKKVKTLKGAVLASHVDRESYSIVGQLGFIPDNLDLDGLEISARADKEAMKSEYKDFTIAAFSDAHFLSDIGKTFTTFFLKAPTVLEIMMAFHGDGGRRVMV